MQKNDSSTYDVIIAGGGLAALVSSIILGRKGFKVLLLEKRNYPFHKVCGEYVSNEVLEFLCSIGFDPHVFGASKITKLRFSDSKGNNLYANLDSGGFGISRYKMDYELFRIALSSGVEIKEGCRVNNIQFNEKIFEVDTSSGNYFSTFVIGAYGKRDLLDRRLEREFIGTHTGYMGVKYHIITDYPADEIGLYTFKGGYCGIVKIEDSKYNLCYLYHRNESYKFTTIRELEEEVLFRNPALKNIFIDSEFVSQTPEVINEIYFDKKECVSNHILFCGDSAGLITPICGNGMSMAIHGAVILAEALMTATPGEIVNIELRNKIERDYSQDWRAEFSSRLFIGRQLQQLSLYPLLTSTALKIINSIPSIKDKIVSSTHGKTLKPFSLKSTHQLHQTFHQ